MGGGHLCPEAGGEGAGGLCTYRGVGQLVACGCGRRSSAAEGLCSVNKNYHSSVDCCHLTVHLTHLSSLGRSHFIDAESETQRSQVSLLMSQLSQIQAV